jgi:hypothetical protein
LPGLHRCRRIRSRTSTQQKFCCSRSRSRSELSWLTFEHCVVSPLRWVRQAISSVSPADTMRFRYKKAAHSSTIGHAQRPACAKGRANGRDHRFFG